MTTNSNTKATKPSTKATKTPKTPKANAAPKEKHLLATQSFVGDADLKVTVRLQHKGGKYLANALFLVKGEKGQVGCRSSHEIEADARKAFDAIVAQAKQLGWRDPEPKAPKTAKPRNTVGKFDLKSFPVPVKTTVITKDEAEGMFTDAEKDALAVTLPK